jgi:hypothetical protein
LDIILPKPRAITPFKPEMIDHHFISSRLRGIVHRFGNLTSNFLRIVFSRCFNCDARVIFKFDIDVPTVPKELLNFDG